MCEVGARGTGLGPGGAKPSKGKGRVSTGGARKGWQWRAEPGKGYYRIPPGPDRRFGCSQLRLLVLCQAVQTGPGHAACTESCRSVSLPGPPPFLFLLGSDNCEGLVGIVNEKRSRRLQNVQASGAAVQWGFKGGAHKRRSLKGRCVCVCYSDSVFFFVCFFFVWCASFLCVTPSSVRREFDRRLDSSPVSACLKFEKGWRTRGTGRCRNWAAPRKAKGFKRWGSGGCSSAWGHCCQRSGNF